MTRVKMTGQYPHAGAAQPLPYEVELDHQVVSTVWVARLLFGSRQARGFASGAVIGGGADYRSEVIRRDAVAGLDRLDEATVQVWLQSNVDAQISHAVQPPVDKMPPIKRP